MKLLKYVPAVLAAATLATPMVASAQSSGLSINAGVYQCELNQNVHIRKVSDDKRQAVLSWAKKDYTMKAVDTQSGALRYEDKGSGLVWLMISGKSMLLNAKQGQRLADNCRA